MSKVLDIFPEVGAELPEKPRLLLMWQAPFSKEKHIEALQEGATLSEIMSRTPGLPADFKDVGVILLGDNVIPRSKWNRVRPRAGKEDPNWVHFYYPIRKGGGGGAGKAILGVAAAVGLTLVTSGIAGGALATSGGLFAAGSTSAKVLSAAVGLAGSLAISALTPPPSVPKAEDERKQRFSGFSGNVLEPGGIVPWVIGQMRVEPPAACYPLVELVGDDTETAEIVLLYGGPVEWSDIRVDDVDAGRIEKLSIETREGRPSDTATTNVTRYSNQKEVRLLMTEFEVKQDDPILLSNQSSPADASPVWHGLTTDANGDEFWINISCPQGIMDQGGASSAEKFCALPLRIRFRERGSGTWINGPEFHIGSRQGAPSKYCIKLKWETAPSMVKPRADLGFIQAFTKVGSEWTADSYFWNGSGDRYIDDGNWDTTTGVRRITLKSYEAILHLAPGTFPKGVYEVEIIRGSIARVSGSGEPGPIGSPSNYVSDGFNPGGGQGDTLFDFWTDGGDKKAPVDQADLLQTVYIERVATIWNEHPIQNPGEFAVISLKVKGRVLGTISALAKGLVNDLDGGDWDNLTTTSNPAPWMLYLLRGKVNYQKVHNDSVDYDGLEAWRTRCNNRGYQCNMEVKGLSIAEAARIVASCGYAQTYWNDKWGVVEDRDRSGESAVSLFSPRDINDWNIEKNTEVLPDHYIVKFINKDREYKADELLVYSLDNTEETTELPEVIEYIGLVTEEEVIARAQFDDQVARKRLARYSFKTGRKSLNKRRGDLIAANHDSIDMASGDARIVSITREDPEDDESDVIRVKLDAAVPQGYAFPLVDGSPLYAGDVIDSTSDDALDMMCTIEFRNGDIVEREFTFVNDYVIQFDTPIPDVAPTTADPNPWYNISVTTGPVSRGTHKRLIVMSVLPEDGRFAATITAVDEAPDLPYPNFS